MRLLYDRCSVSRFNQVTFLLQGISNELKNAR